MTQVSAHQGGFHPNHDEVHGFEGGDIRGMGSLHRTEEARGQDRMQGFSLGDPHPHSTHLMGMMHQLHRAVGTFGGGQGLQGQRMQGQGMQGQINALGGQSPSTLIAQIASMGGQTANLLDGGSHFGHQQQLSTMQTPFGEAHFGRDAQFSITQNNQMLDVTQFAKVPGLNGTAEFGRHTLEQNFANPLQPNNPAHFLNDQQYASIPSLAGQLTYNRSEQSMDIPGVSSSHTLAEFENLPAGQDFSGFPQSNITLPDSSTLQPRPIAESGTVQPQATGVMAPGAMATGAMATGAMATGAIQTPAMPAPPLQTPVFNANDSSVSDGRYTLRLDGTDRTKIVVTDALTNSTLMISGDPHLITGNGDKASFQNHQLVATLDEGGKLIFTPGAPDKSGATTLSRVDWTERGQTATIAGMSGTGNAAITTDMTKQAELPTNAIFLSTGQKGLNQLYIGGANQPQNNQLMSQDKEQNLDPYASNTQTD